MKYNNMYFDKFNEVIFNNEKTKDIITAYDAINIEDNGEFYLEYYIKGAKTPDQLSYEIYGDASFYWIILVLNKIQNSFFDLPLSDDEIKIIAKQKAQDNNNMGNYLDYYYKEEEENNKKRKIKIVNPERLYDFLSFLQNA